MTSGLRNLFDKKNIRAVFLNDVLQIMKILVINYEYPPIGGGAAGASYHIARELVKLGCSVFVITSKFKNLPANEVIEDVKIFRIPAWRKKADRSSVAEMITFMLSGMWYGLRFLKKERPDATLAFFTIPCSHIGLLGKWFQGIPYIISLRGGDVPGTQPEQLAFFHALTRPAVKILWRKAAWVVANSKGLAALAKQTTPELDIKIIPNGVDLEQFSPVLKLNDDRREVVRILYVGRASAEKNIIEAFKALKMCDAKNWRFDIIGDGPQLPAWKTSAVSFGFSDSVNFQGWMQKENLPDLYPKYDLFIFPSTSEGMPNVLLEAMACGLLVIATRIRGNEDIVEHEINGFLYEPGDASKLSSFLSRLLLDNNLRIKMSLAARKRAESFSWKNTAEEYLKIINQSIKQRRRQ